MHKHPLLIALFSLSLSFALSVGAVAQEAKPQASKAGKLKKKRAQPKPGEPAQASKKAPTHVDAPGEGTSDSVKQRFVEDQKEKDKK